MRLETYPFGQHALIIKKKKEKKETQYNIKISSHLFREQKKPKKKAKTLKPKTSSPIKIHTRSDYRLFSVPSNTQIGLELQQKRRYKERRKDRKSSNTPKK